MRHYVKAFFLIFSFLFCLFAFRLFIFVKNDIIILIFNPLSLFSRKRGPFMNRTQKLGNVLIISSRKRMLSEFQSYLHSVLGEYLTFNTLLREQATDPSLFRGYQCVLFPTARAKIGRAPLGKTLFKKQKNKINGSSLIATQVGADHVKC